MFHFYKYPRPSVTTDAIVTSEKNGENYILLVRRKHEPFKNMWALPGGFINMNETLLEACKRELEEETGLSGINLEQFFTFDAVNRDPRGRTISVVFYAHIPKPVPAKGSDDALEALWFPFVSLPPMAFDHEEIIKMYQESKIGKANL